MAEHRRVGQGGEPLRGGTRANRSSWLDGKSHLLGCRVLGQVARQAAHEVDDQKNGDARRSYVERYRRSSMRNRRFRGRFRPLPMVGPGSPISCHRGVNIGANLFGRHDICRPPGPPRPEIPRAPSLRNVSTMALYFHDGSSPTLDDTVRGIATEQPGRALPDQQVSTIVVFPPTMTGNFDGAPVFVPSP